MLHEGTYKGYAHGVAISQTFSNHWVRFRSTSQKEMMKLSRPHRKSSKYLIAVSSTHDKKRTSTEKLCLDYEEFSFGGTSLFHAQACVITATSLAVK
jgi:hypothetical protein